VSGRATRTSSQRVVRATPSPSSASLSTTRCRCGLGRKQIRQVLRVEENWFYCHDASRLDGVSPWKQCSVWRQPPVPAVIVTGRHSLRALSRQLQTLTCFTLNFEHEMRLVVLVTPTSPWGPSIRAITGTEHWLQAFCRRALTTTTGASLVYRSQGSLALHGQICSDEPIHDFEF
jgi:hypothetical protein